MITNPHSTSCPAYIPWSKEACNCETMKKDRALDDLRYLLTFPRLGEWGMEALKDTLTQIIPEDLTHTDLPRLRNKLAIYPET